VTLRDIAQARELVDRVHIDDKVRDYIVDLVQATRDPGAYGIKLGGTAPAPARDKRETRAAETGDRLIDFGASPRATINLALAARASAFLDGRAYATPHDVKTIAPDVLRHRVVVSYEAEAQEITSEMIVKKILDSLPVP
jgi:MoxR-like ATPase